MALVPTPTEALSAHVEKRAKAAGVPWDKYHVDFLLGVAMDWLGAHGAALTANGVHKVADLP